MILIAGDFTDQKQTDKVLSELMQYPASVVLIKIGNGPFDQLQDFCDDQKSRKNVQVLDYTNPTASDKMAEDLLEEVGKQFNSFIRQD